MNHTDNDLDEPNKDVAKNILDIIILNRRICKCHFDKMLFGMINLLNYVNNSFTIMINKSIRKICEIFITN